MLPCLCSAPVHMKSCSNVTTSTPSSESNDRSVKPLGFHCRYACKRADALVLSAKEKGFILL